MRNIETYDEFYQRRKPPKWWKPSLDRQVLKGLMRRRNLPAIQFYGGWFLLLAALGYSAAVLYLAGSAWSIAVFIVYGTFFSMNNSHMHESLHGTPFKTPLLNKAMFFITSAMEFRATTLTHWRHMHHHAWTIIKETDLEIQAPRPVKLWKVLIEFFYSVPPLI
jgi:fatty acid desaturase